MSRGQGGRALATIGGSDAVLALASALADRDAAMRLNAMHALGEIGGPAARPYLEPMQWDEDDVVREAAAQWLAEM